MARSNVSVRAGSKAAADEHGFARWTDDWRAVIDDPETTLGDRVYVGAGFFTQL